MIAGALLIECVWQKTCPCQTDWPMPMPVANSSTLAELLSFSIEITTFNGEKATAPRFGVGVWAREKETEQDCVCVYGN